MWYNCNCWEEGLLVRYYIGQESPDSIREGMERKLRLVIASV